MFLNQKSQVQLKLITQNVFKDYNKEHINELHFNVIGVI